MTRGYERCDCGAEPRKIPPGCHPFTIDVDSEAGQKMLAAEREAAIPAAVIDQVATLLSQHKVPFVLTWIDRGELQTLHGLGPHVVAGPRSQAKGQ
jgi:hypothetical protein